MGADECGENGGENADDNARVHESDRHGQNAGAKRCFQQMRESFGVAVKRILRLIFVEQFLSLSLPRFLSPFQLTLLDDHFCAL